MMPRILPNESPFNITRSNGNGNSNNNGNGMWQGQRNVAAIHTMNAL